MKITGIRAVARDTKDIRNGHAVQVFVDTGSGEVWGRYHVGSGNYTRYDNPEILCCGFLYSPSTMKQVREMVMAKLREATGKGV